LINEELHNLYSSPNIITLNDQVKEVDMCRACSTHEDEDCVHNFGGKAGRTWTTKRHRRRRVDNVVTCSGCHRGVFDVRRFF
jgi:hypothetical protein